MEWLKKNRKWFYIAATQVFIVGLSVRCAPDEVSHGTYYLTVPNSTYGHYDYKRVEFFLDEPVGEGTMDGWITGNGCEAIVDLCYDDFCETVFWDYVDVGEEVYFKVDSEDSVVFSDYLYEFEPCYKEGEFASEPFSCQNWSCGESKHDIEIYLESPCAATMLTDIEVEYLDMRVPFLGCLFAAEIIDDAGDCDDYECTGGDDW